MLQRWPGRESTRKARRHGRSTSRSREQRAFRAFPLGRLGGSMRATNEPGRASALGAGLSWPLRRGWVFLVATDRRSTPPGHSRGPMEGGRRDAQAARTAIEMVWQEEGLIVFATRPRSRRIGMAGKAKKHRVPNPVSLGAEAKAPMPSLKVKRPKKTSRGK